MTSILEDYRPYGIKAGTKGKYGNPIRYDR